MKFEWYLGGKSKLFLITNVRLLVNQPNKDTSTKKTLIA